MKTTREHLLAGTILSAIALALPAATVDVALAQASLQKRDPAANGEQDKDPRQQRRAPAAQPQRPAPQQQQRPAQRQEAPQREAPQRPAAREPARPAAPAPAQPQRPSTAQPDAPSRPTAPRTAQPEQRQPRGPERDQAQPDQRQPRARDPQQTQPDRNERPAARPAPPAADRDDAPRPAPRQAQPPAPTPRDNERTRDERREPATRQAPAQAPTQAPTRTPAQAPAQTPSLNKEPTPTRPEEAQRPAPTRPEDTQRPAAAPTERQPQPRATDQAPTTLQAPSADRRDRFRRLDDLRDERREERQGDRTVIREPDRTIIREEGRTIIRHNEVDRFRATARDVRTERRGDDTVTIIERPDGTRIITVTDDDGRLLRRSRRGRDGREVVIIDNQFEGRRGRDRRDYYVDLPPPVIRIPRERYIVEAERASPEDIYEVLVAPPVDQIERRYTLDEVRYSPALRDRMPRIDLDTINFELGSWEITSDQVDRLAALADAINRALQRNPDEVFLIEGHTDAVGSDIDNLSLSDRRAESVAIALTEQFQVPAENLTTQGYGEQYLKVQTDGPSRENRRVTMRRITPLLAGQQQQR